MTKPIQVPSDAAWKKQFKVYQDLNTFGPDWVAEATICYVQDTMDKSISLLRRGKSKTKAITTLLNAVRAVEKGLNKNKKRKTVLEFEGEQHELKEVTSHAARMKRKPAVDKKLAVMRADEDAAVKQLDKEMLTKLINDSGLAPAHKERLLENYGIPPTKFENLMERYEESLRSLVLEEDHASGPSTKLLRDAQKVFSTAKAMLVDFVQAHCL